MSARRSTTRDAGFTLVEALVGLLLVSGVAAGASYLLIVVLTSVRDARDEVTATLLAIQRLEQITSAIESGAAVTASPDNALEVDAAGFSDRVDAAANPETSAAPSAGAAFVRRWRVAPVASPGAWTIQVRVIVSRRAAATPAPASGGARSPGEVLLATVRRVP
jgi:type II secretory pathway pseudopilin PulG